MKKHSFTFRPDSEAEKLTVTCLLPESVAEAVSHYGEEGVLGLINRAVVVDIQGADRAMYKREKNSVKDPAAISAENERWKPGVRQGRLSQVEKMKTKLASLSPEEKRELLAQMAADAKVHKIA